MHTLKPYSFHIIRYVPDVIREEFINIGILVFDRSVTRACLVKLTDDWTRLCHFAQDVDVELLQALGADLTRRFAEDPEGESFINLMKDSFSGTLQISSERGRAAESMNVLADHLMELYVLPSVRRTLFAIASGS